MEFPEEIYYSADGKPNPGWLDPDPARRLVVERAFLLGWRLAFEYFDRPV